MKGCRGGFSVLTQHFRNGVETEYCFNGKHGRISDTTGSFVSSGRSLSFGLVVVDRGHGTESHKGNNCEHDKSDTPTGIKGKSQATDTGSKELKGFSHLSSKAAPILVGVGPNLAR